MKFLKPSFFSYNCRQFIKKMKPFWVHLMLYLLRIRGLVYKGKYRRYVSKDPDFSLLINKIFFLVSFGRSGTTALYELMNTHPAIYAYNEILNPASFFNFFDFVDQCSAIGILTSRPEQRERLFKWYLYNETRRHSDYSVVIFDLKIESMQSLQKTWAEPVWSPLVLELAKKHSFGILHVRRDNLLARTLSSLKSSANGMYHQYNKTVAQELTTIYIPTEDLVQKFDQTMEAHQYIEKFFAFHVNYAQITYENFFEKDISGLSYQFSKSLAQLLANLLGIQCAFDLTPRTQKIGSSNYTDIIENYQQVCAALQGTPYEKFLLPDESDHS